jgi:N,N-dimethylformamidase
VSWIRFRYIRLFTVGSDPNPNPDPDPVYEKTVNLCILNKEKQLLTKILNVEAKQQEYVQNAFAIGCNWDTTHAFTIPSDYKSDIYFIEIIDEFCNIFSTYFIVKNPIYNTDTLVLSNGNTTQAYNDWAGLDGDASYYTWVINTGDDTYKNIQTNVSNYLSNQRPNYDTHIGIRTYFQNLFSSPPIPHWSNKIAGEMYLLNWLKNNNIKYDIIDDLDFHCNEKLLQNYKILIIHNHPEYWTKNMMIALNKFRDNGGKILYLGGNGLYWKVTYDKTSYIMENRKNNSIHSQDGLIGGVWKNIGYQLSPYDTTNDLVGSDYIHLVDRDIEPFGSPYRILQPSHWVFSGITDTLVGIKSLNGPTNSYYDGTTGASGFEMDRNIQGTHTQYIIAEGENPNNNGAHMLYFEKNSGKIFSVGSIVYTGSLSVDENISKITKNVIDYMLLPDVFFEKYNTDEIKDLLITLQ